MLSLQSAVINGRSQMFPYCLSTAQGRGLADILSYYVPRGSIRQVVTYFRSGGLLPLYVGHSEYYDFDALVTGITGIPGLNSAFRDSMFGGGKGSDLPSMFISAAAETVERAVGALGFFDLEADFIFASFREMQAQGLNCTGPEELRLFAPEQFDDPTIIFEPFGDDTRLRWIRGTRLVSEKETWMPAQIVLPYYQRYEGESAIGYSTTGGLACHINREEALLHGVLELIERDAVNLHWNCGRCPTRIEVDRQPTLPALAHLMETAATLPVEFEFYLHLTEFTEVPVITVIGFTRSFHRYSYYAGGGVGLDMEEAMHYALSEFGQSEGTLRTLAVAPEWDLAASARRLFDIGEHVQREDIDHFFKIVTYYGYPGNAKKLNWYLRDNPVVHLSSVPARPVLSTAKRFKKMMAALAEHKIDPITFDLTPSHMSQLRIIKTYSPDLTPPYVQSLPLLGNGRYYKQPQKLGWTDRELKFGDFTVDPQPYP